MTIHEETLATIQETIYSSVLPSGLRVFVLPKRGFAKKFASFAVHYGSIDNRFRLSGQPEWVGVPDGIAHFLEHQLFAQEYGDAFEKFSEMGASANAFTSYHTTCYLFSATSRFAENLDLLLDFVQTPYFTDQGTEKERGIIIQEINMYRDNPGWRLNQNLREALFVNHPFRIDIAGTAESVSQITTQLLKTCYQTFYRPNNMVVSIVGDVDPEAMVERVSKRVEGRGHPDQAIIERALVNEPEHIKEKQVVERMAVARPMFAVGFKDHRRLPEGRAVVEREFLTEIALQVLFGTASDFYNRLYEEGLIDDSFSASYYGEASYGMTTVSGETDDPDRVQQLMLEELQKAVEQGLAEEEVDRVRRSLYGEMVRVFDSIESLSYLINNSFFRNVSIFEYLRVLEQISLDDVNRRVREHLNPQNYAVSIIRPD